MAHRARAEAAGTTLDRVAVYGVHQHNAPPVFPAAAALVAQRKDQPRVFDAGFFQRGLDAGRIALKAAIPQE